MVQQQQQGAMLTGVVHAIAAAQLMEMIYVSSAHQATNTADIDSASSLCHESMIMSAYTSIKKYLRGTEAWAATVRPHSLAGRSPALPVCACQSSATHGSGSTHLRPPKTHFGSDLP